MSFWKKAGDLALKAGSAILSEANAAAERNKQYKEEMPLKSDNELLSIVNKERSGSPMKAGAALQELKSRGHSPEEIKEKILKK